MAASDDPVYVDLSICGEVPVASPDPFYVTEGQTLCFRSSHCFGVDFQFESPMGGRLVYESAGHEYTAYQTIRRGASRTEYYKYTIALCDMGTNRVVIADPRGIVDEDPVRT